VFPFFLGLLQMMGADPAEKLLFRIRLRKAGSGETVSAGSRDFGGIWYGAGWIVLIWKFPSSSMMKVPRRFHSGMFGANWE